jgi:hypothetical protein
LSIPVSILACWVTASTALHVPLPEPRPVVVSGAVWVVEEGGEPRPARAGRVRLCFDTPEGCASVESELEAGAFVCALPPGTQAASVGGLVIEGRDAVPASTLVADVTRPIALEARFLPESRVRMRLADTGQELGTALFGAPGVPREVDLPYVVPLWGTACSTAGWERVVALEARAPGYAWQPLAVDLLTGGDCWIELVPEACLALTVRMPPEGWPPQRVRVSARRGWRREFTVERDGSVIALGGLAAGRYEVVSSRAAPGEAVLIERASLELAPGEKRHIEIDLAVEPPAAVSGENGASTGARSGG